MDGLLNDPSGLLLLVLIGAFLTTCVHHLFTYLTDQEQKLSLLFAIWIFVGLNHHLLELGKFNEDWDFSSRVRLIEAIILIESYISTTMLVFLLYADIRRYQGFLIPGVLLTILGGFLLPELRPALHVAMRLLLLLAKLYFLYQLWRTGKPGFVLLITASLLFSTTILIFGSGPISFKGDYPILSQVMVILSYVISINLYSAYLGRLAALASLKLVEAETTAKNLREIDQLKTRFFSNITHEFRTPLTLIQGPADELLGKTDDKEERKLLGLIKSNSGRLLRLINQLLDLAKLDAHEMKLSLAPVDLGSLVRVTIAQFTSMAESKGVRYGWKIGESLPTVNADPEKLETVLSNLISNAMKFTSAGGAVDIQANWDGKYFVFALRDTGRGIPVEKLPYIFDRFYQASPTDATHSEGTGIGLALVKEYTEIMKGILEVESNVGSGTTFMVKLPFTTVDVKGNAIESAPGQSDAPPAAAIASEENGQLPLLLLVEDNAELRSFVRTCLGSEYRFCEASHGREGMTMAVNQVPDLIISDLMMPEMDGLELCTRLKKDKRTDHIPFIMLTAKAADENKLEGLRTGADEYLVKPFNKAELLLKVQNLITLRSNLQTHIRTEILAKASEVRAESAEEQFVLKARLFVEAHAKDEALSVETLAQEMNLSREQCYRKISALTGLAPSAFIRKIKLQRAHQLLSSRWGPVSQVAYEAGFENLSYFSKTFKEEFGKLPSEVQE
jgi:signal transduction histidine kinase/DNA-binding response OmpR family regulator